MKALDFDTELCTFNNDHLIFFFYGIHNSQSRGMQNARAQNHQYGTHREEEDVKSRFMSMSRNHTPLHRHDAVFFQVTEGKNSNRKQNKAKQQQHRQTNRKNNSNNNK